MRAASLLCLMARYGLFCWALMATFTGHDGFLTPASSQTTFTSIYDAVQKLSMTYVEAVIKIGKLEAVLSDPNLQAVMFLPTDAAFQKAFNTMPLNLFISKAASNATIAVTFLQYHVVPLPTPNPVIPVVDKVYDTWVTSLPAGALPTVISSITTKALYGANSPILYLGGVPGGVFLNTSNTFLAGQSRVYPIDDILIMPDVQGLPSAIMPDVTLLGAMKAMKDVSSVAAILDADPELKAFATNTSNVVTFFAPSNNAIQAYLNKFSRNLASFLGTQDARNLMMAHIIPSMAYATSRIAISSPSTRLDSRNTVIYPSAKPGFGITVQRLYDATTQGVTVLVTGPSNVVPLTLQSADTGAGKSVIHVLSEVLAGVETATGGPLVPTTVPSTSASPAQPVVAPPVGGNTNAVAPGGGGIPAVTPAPAPSKKTTAVGAIAGGVVGGVVGIALLAALAMFLIRRSRSKPDLVERHSSISSRSKSGTQRYKAGEAFMPAPGKPGDGQPGFARGDSKTTRVSGSGAAKTSGFGTPSGQGTDTDDVQIVVRRGSKPDVVKAARALLENPMAGLAGNGAGSPAGRTKIQVGGGLGRYGTKTVPTKLEDGNLPVTPVMMSPAALGEIPIKGMIPGDPFCRGTAPCYSWIHDFDPTKGTHLESGLNDAQHDVMHQPGGGPPLELTREQVVGEIELLSNGMLGRGAHGLVFKCRWPSRFGPDVLLAAKLLKDPFEGSTAVYNTFAYEAAVLASVRHPNVVRMYGFCLQLPTVCIIMELLPVTLKHRLYSKPAALQAMASPAVTADHKKQIQQANADAMQGKACDDNDDGSCEDGQQPSTKDTASGSAGGDGVVSPATPAAKELQASVASPHVEQALQSTPSSSQQGEAVQEGAAGGDQGDAEDAQAQRLRNKLDLKAVTAHLSPAARAALSNTSSQKPPNSSSSVGKTSDCETPRMRGSDSGKGGLPPRTPKPTGATRSPSTSGAPGPKSGPGSTGQTPTRPYAHSNSQVTDTDAGAMLTNARRGVSVSSPGSALSTAPPAKLSLGEVLQLSADIAAGLSHLHARPDPMGTDEGLERLMPAEDDLEVGIRSSKIFSRIVHRDLKPSNILIGTDGRAKISDFGLSRGHNETTLFTNQYGVGTLRYMAPELLVGYYSGPYAQHVTNRVDIFSLAMVMWEMLQGQMPWGELTDTQILAAVIGRKRPPLDVPQRVSISGAGSMPVSRRESGNFSESGAAAAGNGRLSREGSSVFVSASTDPLYDFKLLINMCWQQRELKRPTAENVHAQLTSLLQVAQQTNRN